MACDYLRHSRLAVSEVAHLLGYQELSAFSHAFRQWFGCSPQGYRSGLIAEN
jgi:AraC-like DNA-binding protein